ncbi:MAG TPA: bifunctional 5,10-methylenetetrahydrofolate dehydrogenase/5,10-methenyltetrahydrofolate cyclohydrolase [Nitrospirae bacterium]|nr:bifunctional protein FolD protein [bacterium BMS3Abin07]GBE31587.1 bifunctional protein FolD protein [bacterium BMS3Bbin05]HDO21818.1 bifunctional 5,10-methylenetetrahydrofolate dehydrogenase/5,10-methenyltetrahydrofolate cyclohydrolase [Nitrospirota bacterium]HDO35268.1 bifunctional 5,10-methylenetetrahydrofolate dehydrogenase/5,10-methenyltetrahydrofolate cyclohydrolase [Nitrospirota bacterium]HDZ88158.1 bifunctional 5,10-methylenetetrahydrofolate dehydrogenase/5,10-methenyltetrahydrofolat
MTQIMDGRVLSDKIKNNVRKEVEQLRGFGIEVGLGLLLVGDNPASEQYFLATLKACKKVGITSYEFKLSGNTSVNEVLNVIHSCNTDERINGLLVLFPLPERINARRVVNEIIPGKDVDGLGAISVGRLAADESTFQIFREGSYELLHESRFRPSISSFLPCTPFGVIRLLEFYGVEMKGMHAVVVGKSLAVGKPLSNMLLAKEATVTVCHRGTYDLGHFLGHADIVCSATGVRNLIRGDMVREGAVVVDIGIKVLDDGTIVGDVDYESVKKKASLITPVPGGVGPVTISMLLENTLRSAQRNELLKSPLMMG